MKSIEWFGRKTGTGLAVAGLVALAFGSSGASAKMATASSPTAVPAKYRVVTSGPLNAANGLETHGFATCPVVSGVQTRPQGGGVFTTSQSLLANVNSSYPSTDGKSWNVDVNNASGFDTTFQVYAICAKPHKAYTVVNAVVSNPSGFATPATVYCPSGTKVLGGGAFSNLGLTSVNISQSIPVHNGTQYGWNVYIANASGTNGNETVYAVCSKYSISNSGYTLINGGSFLVGSGSQGYMNVTCPSSEVPLGGGEGNDSTSTAVTLNGTRPTAHGWESWLNNSSSVTVTFTSWAVCAF